MKKILLPFIVFACVAPTKMFAQSASKDYAVLLTAEVQESPARIKIKWKADNSTSVVYSIYRKSPESSVWSDTLATLDSTATEFSDNNVLVGKAYEYQVKKRKTGLTMYGQPISSSYYYPYATGYIMAGVKVPAQTSRGKMILLVDQNYATPLATEITQLENDLIGDGWELIRHNIARNATVASVKQIIRNDYTTQAGVKSLFLLGRIPVPYSGGFKAAQGFTYPPDGHPDHSGAWPADVYYGTMNEDPWTDNTVTDSTASRLQNRNLPGDGKFDINNIDPDTTSLQIGRVDFSNMPAFGQSDTILMKRYLSKDHLFKTGVLRPERRALVTDNFGSMNGEAFASSGYRPFSTMFGDSVTTVGGGGVYFTQMRTNTYLWAYGSGAGSYNSAGGIGATTNFANDSLLNVFSMLFGSYFGDWDSQDNLLRAPLAHKGWTLANMWSGRPYGIMHPMALGENIGYCTKLSQNNIDEAFYFKPGRNKGYAQNFNPKSVHLALMGDPGLRMHVVLPVSNLTLTTINNMRHVVLTWNRSTDNNISNYLVFRSNARNGSYTLLSTLPPTDSTFTDGQALDGVNYYMIRAVKLENTPSGSYYNLSIGTMDTISAKRYVGMPEPTASYFNIYPNPAQGSVNIKASFDDTPLSVGIFDVQGRLIHTAHFTHVQSTQPIRLDVSFLKSGIYYLELAAQDKRSNQKLVVIQD